MKSVAQKMGIREDISAYLANAPEDAINAIDLPKIRLSKTLRGDFDYIHLFVKTQAEQSKLFPKLKAHLKLTGMLWVSWPKARQLDSDLTLPKVIEIGYEFGLVESTSLSVNDIWSALKFTHPKAGKLYNNSYGKLKPRTTNR